MEDDRFWNAIIIMLVINLLLSIANIIQEVSRNENGNDTGNKCKDGHYHDDNVPEGVTGLYNTLSGEFYQKQSIAFHRFVCNGNKVAIAEHPHCGMQLGTPFFRIAVQRHKLEVGLSALQQIQQMTGGTNVLWKPGNGFFTHHYNFCLDTSNIVIKSRHGLAWFRHHGGNDTGNGFNN